MTGSTYLLKQVTGSTYLLIRLTENYLLEIADGDRLHLLKRFSGGEQGLAALCLRLALSRTLARQRGAEHGFIILDEVFQAKTSNVATEFVRVVAARSLCAVVASQVSP